MISCPTPALGKLAEEAYVDGYKRYGDLGLALNRYESHLHSIVEKHLGSCPAQATLISFFDDLHKEDLYLAASCAEASEPGWRCFVSSYSRYIYKVANSAFAAIDMSIEIADCVIADMFLPDRSGCSRIASYDGRSSLAVWLRVIVLHKAIKERKRKSNNQEPLESSSEEADEAAISRIDATLRANRYKDIIRESFECASRALTARERMLLLMRYEEKLREKEIARIFNVSPSTITRHLHAVYDKLHQEIISILLSRYGLTTHALEECLTDILENPSHSILTFIERVRA
ncbi:MAG TPA: sigma-70 family RNA polymerase sigma factor [Blastocatellia bacterium]|nr:sigma-70 family RNA polymerase sigma factor [Blastocatellia bacterium]